MTENEPLGIGEALRDARMTQGLSLGDVATQLKIREDHLHALEEEQFAILPGDVYVIGFVRTYANHLGLNSADLTARYKDAIKDDEAEEPSFIVEEEEQSISLALKIGLGIIVLLVAYMIWLIASSTDNQRGSALRRLPSNLAVKSETPADTKPNSENASDNPRDNIVPRVEPPPKAETTTLTPTPAPTAVPPAVEARRFDTLPEKIEIRATARTWMRIESDDGRVLFSSIVNQGDGFVLLVEHDYVLATRDAGALAFFVEGQSLGKVGRRGQILTARKITPATVIRRANRFGNQE